MTSPSIVPFRCDACEALFEPKDGGICQSCRRLLCGDHFSIDHFSILERWPIDTTTTAPPKPRGPICRQCAARGVAVSDAQTICQQR